MGRLAPHPGPHHRGEGEHGFVALGQDDPGEAALRWVCGMLPMILAAFAGTAIDRENASWAVVFQRGAGGEGN